MGAAEGSASSARSIGRSPGGGPDAIAIAGARASGSGSASSASAAMIASDASGLAMRGALSSASTRFSSIARAALHADTSARPHVAKRARIEARIASARFTASMNENVARPTKMRPTIVSPMMVEPTAEKSARITSPKSSPAAPLHGIAPNATAPGDATCASAAKITITSTSPAMRAAPAIDGLRLSSGDATSTSSIGKNHATTPTTSTSARAIVAPTGPTQSAPSISGRIGSPRNDASASDK